MIDALMGRKIGMTQVFSETGEAIPVTVLEIGPNFVTQIKTSELDGYEAVQLGYRESKKLNKPERGHTKKAGTAGLKHLHEVRAGGDGVELGQQVGVDIFNKGEKVDVTVGAVRGTLGTK